MLRNVLRNAKFYDDPVQIIKLNEKVSKIRVNADRSKMYTEYAHVNGRDGRPLCLYANKKEARHLYIGAYDKQKGIFVFRRIEGIYEPRMRYSDRDEDDTFEEYDVCRTASFFECGREMARERRKEEDDMQKEYLYLYGMLSRQVVVNTKDFLDMASLNSTLSRMQLLMFLNENTMRFRGRKVLTNNFYDDELREKRMHMLDSYDRMDVSDMRRYLKEDFFIFEELHTETDGRYTLKGYDESAEDVPSTSRSSHQEDLIDIFIRKEKMVSVEHLIRSTPLAYDHIMEIVSTRKYIRLFNGKYTLADGEYQHVRKQVLDILQNSDRIRRKDITFDNESHFKTVIKEFCYFEKGMWRLKE